MLTYSDSVTVAETAQPDLLAKRIADLKQAIENVQGTNDVGVLKFITLTLTNTQLKNLRATPITLVAAQGAGKVIEFVSGILKLNQPGTNALTESTANLAIRYKDGSTTQVSDTIEMTGFIEQTVNMTTSAKPKIDQIAIYSSQSSNQPLVIHNEGAGEFGGNAANDATLTIEVGYRVHTI